LSFKRFVLLIAVAASSLSAGMLGVAALHAKGERAQRTHIDRRRKSGVTSGMADIELYGVTEKLTEKEVVIRVNRINPPDAHYVGKSVTVRILPATSFFWSAYRSSSDETRNAEPGDLVAATVKRTGADGGLEAVELGFGIGR
jgi:hypothetical protein